MDIPTFVTRRYVLKGIDRTGTYNMAINKIVLLPIRSRVVTLLLLCSLFKLFFQAEAQEATGLVFLEDARYQSIPLASPPLSGELPESIDLTRSFPLPGEQGRQPSCVGWATAYALKSYQEAIDQGWLPDTEERQFSPTIVYNQIKLSGGGAHFLDAFDVLIEQGAVSLSEFPYVEDDDSVLPNAAQKQKASPFRIATWRRVNPQSKAEVKGQLAANFPVLIGAIVGTAFSQHFGTGTFALPPNETVDGSGHAMCVVGYDNSLKSYRVMNSWGTDWGDSGFAWIEYDTFSRIVREAYVAQDITMPATDKVMPLSPTQIDEVPKIKDPAKVIPQVTIQTPNVTHNRVSNGVPGMAITIAGKIEHAKSRNAQVVTRFSMPDGRMLIANLLEQNFRDASGFVSVGTQLFVVTSNNYDLTSQSFFIPYYALNMQPTGGRMQYSLSATCYVYVDGFEIARSAAAPFVMVW